MTRSCASREAAEVKIKTFNNRKGIGFVTHYDPGSGKGLFLGLYDNGNTDGLTLSTFEAKPDIVGKLTATVPNANVFLGAKIQENVWYALFLDVCYNGDTGHIEALGHVGNTSGNPGLDQGFVIDQDWPAGISTVGQFGIAGWAKSSLVNSSVRAFSWSTNDE